MRPVIISLFLFTAMLLGIYGTTATMENQLEQICDHLQIVEDSILTEDWPLATAAYNQAYGLWQGDATLWHIALDQRDIRDLNSDFMRVGAYLKATDYAQGLAELKALKSQYQYLLILEKVTWNNIF